MAILLENKLGVDARILGVSQYMTCCLGAISRYKLGCHPLIEVF